MPGQSNEDSNALSDSKDASLMKNNDIESLDLGEEAKGSFKLTFTNLTYQVKAKHAKKPKDGPKKYWKTILNACSGYARNGETTYIMGSSGAGKTTLLNALCDRISKKSKKVKFEGEVKINDSIEISQKTFGHMEPM